MNWTNNHNLPAPIVAAIKNDSYKKVGDISITGLISPPQKRVLEKRFQDKITTDISENIFSLFGQLGHAVLERAATKNEISELRMKTTVLGWEVSGQPDLFESLHVSGGLLSDYKFTSVFSFLMGDKPEWEKQLNAYAWLAFRHGIFVKKLQIVAILRDWSRQKAKREPDYPKVPCHVIDIPLWDLNKTEAWIVERVAIHQEAERVKSISDLPECTPEERWQREGQWAVMKDGQKRAVRVLKSEPEAKKYLSEIAKDADKHSIIYRPGEAIRCEDYCKAKMFCAQYAKTIPEGMDMSHSGGY